MSPAEKTNEFKIKHFIPTMQSCRSFVKLVSILKDMNQNTFKVLPENLREITKRN